MRAILFDFGGTLDSPRHWLDRFVDHYRHAGLVLSRATLDPAFDEATRIAYRATASLRVYGLSDLVRYLVHQQFLFLADYAVPEAVELSTQLLSERHRRELVERISTSFVEETTTGLAQSRTILTQISRKYTLGVVSNFYGNLQRVLEEAGFDDVIRVIADSGHLGIYKPDLGIYRTALAMLDLAPSEVAMVGDSLEKDCAPARQLGLTTVWLRHPGMTPTASAKRHADFTIAALEELEQIRWDHS